MGTFLTSKSFLWNFRILLGVVLISLILFAVIIPPIQAAQLQTTSPSTPQQTENLVGWLGNSILKAFNWLLFGIGYLLGFILYIEGKILDWVLGLTQFSKSPVVTTGWAITRDLANMFFILVMIFIAFTTILRIETYRTKELVAKLIIVALLINFSLVIGGVIIDFTQIITTFFLKNAATQGTISENLAHGLQISNIYKTDAGAAEALLDFGQTLLLVFAGLAFAVIFSGIAVFVFAAAILLFLVRIVALWFLLILSPIAWAASILPDTKHLWDKWWSQFLKWAFFAPVYSFFIYLALMIVQQGGIKRQFEKAAIDLGQTQKEIASVNALAAPDKILDMILIVVILIAGIKVAESFGAHGASAAMGYAKKGGIAARNYTGRMARRATVATGAPQAIAKGLSRIPVLRQAARPLRRFEESERAARAQRIGEVQSRAKDWTKENTAAEYQAAIDPQTKAGLLRALTEKKGGLALLNESEIRSGLQTLKGYNMDNEILKTRPDLAPEVGKTVEEAVKMIKPSEIGNIAPPVIENPEVARFLNPGQLEAVFREGLSGAFVKAFPKAIEKGIPAETKSMEYLQASPVWKNIIPEIAVRGAAPKEPSPIITAGKYTPTPPPGERK